MTLKDYYFVTNSRKRSFRKKRTPPLISKIGPGGVLHPSAYFAHSFFSREFFYTLGTAIFRNTSEGLLFIFFLNSNVSNKNLSSCFFCCFFFFKKQTSCTSFVQTVTCNLSNYSKCLPKISPSF